MRSVFLGRRARRRSRCIDQLFRCTVTWLAPMLCFTAEEAWRRAQCGRGVLRASRAVPRAAGDWRDDALAEKWRKVRTVRRVVTGALEVERADKRIGSSLEAAPDRLRVRSGAVCRAGRRRSCRSVDHLRRDPGRRRRGRRRRSGSTEVDGVAVGSDRAEGPKCARSWKISTAVGSDPDYPDVTPRDAQALREWDAHAAKAAE